MADPRDPRAPAEAPDLLSAYLDEQLDGDEAAEVERLLSEDPEARSELDDLRRVIRLVSALPPVEAPPDFVEKVARRLRRRPATGLAASLFSLPFQILSILVILAVAALFMMAELERERVAAPLERDTVQAPPEPSGPPEDDGALAPLRP